MLWFPFKSRANLSPFTKDYRGGEQLNEPIANFWKPTQWWVIINSRKIMFVNLAVGQKNFADHGMMLWNHQTFLVRYEIGLELRAFNS